MSVQGWYAYYTYGRLSETFDNLLLLPVGVALLRSLREARAQRHPDDDDCCFLRLRTLLLDRWGSYLVDIAAVTGVRLATAASGTTADSRRSVTGAGP